MKSFLAGEGSRGGLSWQQGLDDAMRSLEDSQETAAIVKADSGARSQSVNALPPGLTRAVADLCASYQEPQVAPYLRLQFVITQPKVTMNGVSVARFTSTTNLIEWS